MMKKFLKNICAYLMVVFTITLLINALYICRIENYGTMGNQKNDKAYISDVPSNIEICNFGNSHGYYGFDYAELNDRYTCFNFALPSQTMSYNYRILANYSDKISEGAYVFICISYTSFYGSLEIEDSDFESKNKRYYHFLENEYIKEYDFMTDIYVNYLPALTINPVELVRVIIQGSTNKNWWNIETSEEQAQDHAIGRYNGHVAAFVDEEGNRVYNEEEIDALFSMIKLCKEIGAVPVLVTTPYLREYTDLVWEKDPDFYKDFNGIIDRIVQEESVEYFDYSMDERFSREYSLFFNTDHMNIEGAKKFVDILEREIIDRKEDI